MPVPVLVPFANCVHSRGPSLHFTTFACMSCADMKVWRGISNAPGPLLKRICHFMEGEKTLLDTMSHCSGLWCTFEIATFMKDPDKRGQIHIMPLKMGALVVMYAAFWHVLGLSYAIFYMTRQVLHPLHTFCYLCMSRAAFYKPPQWEHASVYMACVAPLVEVSCH